jgi:ribosomal protein L31E
MTKKSIHFWTPEEVNYLVECYDNNGTSQSDAAINFIKKYKNRSIQATQVKLSALLRNKNRSRENLKKSIPFPKNQKIELTNIKKVLINSDGTITIHL